jgi:hypothetical protein
VQLVANGNQTARQQTAQHATFVIERSFGAPPSRVFAAFAKPRDQSPVGLRDLPNGKKGPRDRGGLLRRRPALARRTRSHRAGLGLLVTRSLDRRYRDGASGPRGIAR